MTRNMIPPSATANLPAAKSPSNNPSEARSATSQANPLDGATIGGANANLQLNEALAGLAPHSIGADVFLRRHSGSKQIGETSMDIAVTGATAA